MNVFDIQMPGKDGMGNDIIEIYGRKPPDYAVYATAKRVLVQFADDPDTNAKQRKAMAPLNPVRGEINGLIDGWHAGPAAGTKRRRADRYNRRVGDALIFAFEEDVAGAATLLAEIKQDILDERISWARLEYLIWAVATGLFAMALIGLGRAAFNPQPDELMLWNAAAAGTIGAFFSIALAIRGRTILPDLQRMANNTDAILRVLIGLIAAALLMALIKSGTVSLKIGDAGVDSAKTNRWLFVLIVGFIAGFSERLVPDLLAKASIATDTPAPTPSPPSAQDKNPANPAAATTPDAPAPDAAAPQDPMPDEAIVDHCACGIDLPDADATPDADLPPATGGVAPASTN